MAGLSTDQKWISRSKVRQIDLQIISCTNKWTDQKLDE